MQHAWTSLALVDGFDASVGHLIGDGVRTRIPNAAKDGWWGSEAVRRANASDGPDPLRPWRIDPSTPEFLAAICRRIRAYLGAYERVAAPSIVPCADPTDPGRGAAVAAGLAEAGTVVSPAVDPGDALLAHWQRLTGTRAERPVDVVVCGERWTVVRRYEPSRGSGWWLAASNVVLSSGSQRWVDALAHEIEQRCGDRDAEQRGWLEDAVYAFADALCGADRRQPLRWWGAMQEELSEPFTVSAESMEAWPEVDQLTLDVAALLAEWRAGERGECSVVLGGPGAAWPFLASVLDRRGLDNKPWRSAAPAHDTALGAVAHQWRPV